MPVESKVYPDKLTDLKLEKIADILWKLRVYYLIHNSPSTIPVLSQISPTHTSVPLLRDLF
jgi:hypothetical protein